ncbi:MULTISPECIES: hypothetical protein [Rhodococcus]|jgi:hypothetical protein|uniref:Uncharacterized protein n=2 Tax=Rhodococcus erythropolis TaxID=1833 RepID=C0ZSX9_RHOE4|nr:MULTISPECIES: hypothetical protein [Rhodococcus]EQM31398.1 hypothetical protein N601_22850 [Rhodococcus erythropolis DN1]BAH31952.1 hypothetical protein RER_12440 [Rhodococcus erythropolis PR4]MBS2990741.1 hypothetical protein [Rhodococcus erythropolis]MDF2895035.1 hypothetical protein [Rhodococcus erythropolis]MDN3457269.1 hypothetical protein [Rhodococcus sp. APC 3903]
MTRGVTFRTVFGGPSVPLDFIEELTRLRHRLRGIAMQYDFDLFVVVGGDITVVTDPTGIRLPRVFLGRRTATAQVQMNTDDVMGVSEPRTFLYTTIHAALTELIARVSYRDNDFDADGERAKIEFLILDDSGERESKL